MPYKFSNCVAIQHPNQEEVLKFYRDVIGFKVVEERDGAVELDAMPYRLFLDSEEPIEFVLELVVPDIEKAREELIANGCKIVRWDGNGKLCYIRDPFGLMYNIWEDPTQF